MTFCIESIKVLNIAYLGILFTSYGILLSLIFSEIDKFIFPDHIKLLERLSKKSESEQIELYDYIVLVISTLVDAGIIILLGYSLRQIIKHIPFPLHGICGFDRTRVKEINGGVLIATIVFMSFRFKDKLLVFKNIWKNNKIYVFMQALIISIIVFILNIPVLFFEKN